MNNGLSERDVNSIFSILEKHPEVTQVVLFGSRALGTYKPGSDIDLAIMNDGVSVGSLRKLIAQFEESSLPYKVDLLLYPSIEIKALKEHIDRAGVAFYSTVN